MNITFARWRSLPSLSIVSRCFAVTLISAPSAYAACDFAPVRRQIENVLDRDSTKGGVFRREVADGADPISMIEKLVDSGMREQVDVCRFEVGEYLTKRGFPPFH
jgi:hypothetical protein